MNKKRKKLRVTSKKGNRIRGEIVWYYVISLDIFLILRNSINIATDKPSELSLMLKEYNLFLACLPIAFAIILVLKLIEFFLMRFKSGETVLKDKSVLSWLIKYFHISYKTDQLVLKDETILLVWQFMCCIFGFFIELKWYLIGTSGMLFYLCLYITLNFQDIRNNFMK